MPVRQSEPFTWHSAAPRAGWARGIGVAALCALFAAGGYVLGHSAAPSSEGEPSSQDSVQATPAQPAASDNIASARTEGGSEDSSSSDAAGKRAIDAQSTTARPVAVLNPKAIESAKQEASDERARAEKAVSAIRTVRPTTTLKGQSQPPSQMAQRSRLDDDEDTKSPGSAPAGRLRSRDGDSYQVRRYRDYRDLRGSMLRGEAVR